MSDDMKPLFDPEELERLVERARLDVQSGVKGEPWPKDVELDDEEEDALMEAMHERGHARLHRGLTGLRSAARAYAASRDPKGLRPVVWAAWGLHASGFDVRGGAREVLAGAVQGVGERVFEVPGLAERLARCEVKAVRLALARALPASAEAMPILRALARDADPDVRAAANAKAGASDPWGGAFPISPEGHPREVLEEARAVLEKPGYDHEKEQAVRAFAPLSDALAVACWERVLSAEYVHPDVSRAWVPRLLERPGGGAALAALYARWWRRGDYVSNALLDDAAGLPSEVRARAFDELLEALRELDRRASEGEEVQPYLDSRLARAASAIAPERGDARALLETVLGCPIESAAELASEPHNMVGTILGDVLVRWLEPVRAVLIEARRADMPGRWKRVGGQVWRALGPDPVLRERARAELSAEDPQVREAAVRKLIGDQRDPADGTVEEVALGLYERPELRAALVRGCAAVRPRARRDLEEGRSTLGEAIAVLAHTAPEKQTDAMWSAARALRDGALAGGDAERRRAIGGMPALVRAGDAWEARDLAYAREVVEPAFASDDHGLLGRLLLAIARIDAPESAELTAEIEARAVTEEERALLTEARRFADAMSA